ncbi:MAG: hypothetical protein JW986_05090 [Methanotrichaceae archaeon]|nr:hypothetical protein [Methanotrichaceae archaeon]
MFERLACVLCIAILALTGACSAAEGTTLVSASMGEHIWISAPESIELTLTPETTVESVRHVLVKTNKNLDWTVTASMNRDDGILIDDTVNPSVALSDALTLTTTLEGTKTLEAEKTIYDDPDGDHKTGGQQRDIPVTFGQYSTYVDEEGTYTGVITFTAEYKQT